MDPVTRLAGINPVTGDVLVVVDSTLLGPDRTLDDDLDQAVEDAEHNIGAMLSWLDFKEGETKVEFPSSWERACHPEDDPIQVTRAYLALALDHRAEATPAGQALESIIAHATAALAALQDEAEGAFKTEVYAVATEAATLANEVAGW